MSSNHTILQKWHPDKNLGNDEATAIFQQIHEANSVLSDPRERSWYDSHRDEILRGDDGDEDGDGEGYVVNVWPYFSGSAFSGYGDGAGGFYQIYRGVFEVRARRRRRRRGDGNLEDGPCVFVFGVGMQAAV